MISLLRDFTDITKKMKAVFLHVEWSLRIRTKPTARTRGGNTQKVHTDGFKNPLAVLPPRVSSPPCGPANLGVSQSLCDPPPLPTNDPDHTRIRAIVILTGTSWWMVHGKNKRWLGASNVKSTAPALLGSLVPIRVLKCERIDGPRADTNDWTNKPSR